MPRFEPGLMTLEEWIRNSRLRPADVARLLGISRGNLHDLMRRAVWPRPETVIKIWRLTGGAVTANDFLPEEFLEEQRRARRPSRPSEANEKK